jgi:hypothetical protein
MREAYLEARPAHDRVESDQATRVRVLDGRGIGDPGECRQFDRLSHCQCVDHVRDGGG